MKLLHYEYSCVSKFEMFPLASICHVNCIELTIILSWVVIYSAAPFGQSPSMVVAVAVADNTDMTAVEPDREDVAHACDACGGANDDDEVRPPVLHAIDAQRYRQR